MRPRPLPYPLRIFLVLAGLIYIFFCKFILPENKKKRLVRLSSFERESIDIRLSRRFEQKINYFEMFL